MRTYHSRHILLSLFLLFNVILQAQQFIPGIPHICNYTSGDYNSIEQNWKALQDRRGVMFFGNTNGILNFDGNTWSMIYPSQYLGIVRSLALNEKGTIYAGSINAFGFLASSADGTIKYQALSQQLPLVRQSFNDIWQIACKDDLVFFMARQSIFVFRHNKLFSILNA